jgi:putative salt-induced outer membrane protein
MNKKTLLFCGVAMAVATFSFSQSHAETSFSPLPDNVVASLKAAFGTENVYVLNSVVASAKTDNPALVAEIEIFLNSLAQTASLQNPAPALSITEAALETAMAEQMASIAPAAGDEGFKPEGSIELGANVHTGNTEKQAFNFKGQLDNDFGKWENTAKLVIDLGEENENATDEKYALSDQLRYPLSDIDYMFGELSYVNDRFSGYEYRIDELLGYGRKLITENDFKLTGEIALGARQSSLTTGEDENSALGRVGGKLVWNISEHVEFVEDLKISVGGDATITESETSLKSKLNDALYLKVGFDVEHISDVPAGTENTDTVTKVTVGYDF